MTGLSLADLFDLELLAHREKGDSEEVRRARHRELGKRLAGQGVNPANAGALLHGLVRLGAETDRTPGQAFAAAVRALHALVGVAGLLLGAVLSAGLLHYKGGHPVNILNILAALVLPQLVLLALLLVALIPRGRREPGPFQALLLSVLKKTLARTSPETDPDLLDGLVRRLDSHSGLLRWLLVRAAQIFGVAFNLAALAGCFYRVAFSDIAFGWSTTLDLDPAALHRATAILSWPWSWISPQGAPSLDLVRSSQYSHFESNYIQHLTGHRALSIPLLGGWWPFLLCAIATYGLVPRMIVLSLAEFRVSRILRDTPLRNETFRGIVEGMTAPLLSTRTEGPDGAPFVPPGEAPGPEPALPPPGTAVVAVIDDPKSLPRETLDRLVRERFGWTVSAVLTPQDLESNGAPGSPALVLLSAWEEPTKGHQRRFLALHKADATRLIVVGLYNSDGAADGRLEKIRGRWKRHLHAALDGRPLRVEALGKPS